MRARWTGARWTGAKQPLAKQTATWLAAMVVVAMSGLAALALSPDELLADKALEARARAISAELRCLVCQNQSIDDSDAPLAKDLRVLVRERITAGDDNRQVIDFVVARYGEFVLLRPRLGVHTLVLWLSPLVLLAATAGFIAIRIRRRRAEAGTTKALSAEEEARLKQLIGRS